MMENQTRPQAGSRRPDLNDSEALGKRDARADALLRLQDAGQITAYQAHDCMAAPMSIDPDVWQLLKPHERALFGLA